MTRIIGQLCREWPVLLDERGHGCFAWACSCATAWIGALHARRRDRGRPNPRDRQGPLVAVGWAERIQDSIEGGDHRVRGQDVEDGQHRHGGLGETSGARCLLRMVISKDVVEKRLGDVGELGGVDGSGASRRDTTLPKTARLAMVTESAP